MWRVISGTGTLTALLRYPERNSAPCTFKEDLWQLNPCCDGQTKTLTLLVLADWRPAGSCMYYTEAKCINNSWRYFWKSSRVVPDSSAVKQHERVEGEGEDLFWFFFLIPAYVIWRKRVDPHACLRAMYPRALTCKSHDPKAASW